MLTVTSKAAPDRRGIYEVDFETKRVSRVTEYRRSGDQWKQVSQREYLDYNKEIDPKVFQLEVTQGHDYDRPDQEQGTQHWFG